MTAAGYRQSSGPVVEVINIHGVELPIREYVFNADKAPLHVFQCRWEAGATKEAYTAQESARLNLIRAIWAGRGNRGQKVIEFIVSGYADEAQAREALLRQLDKLIKVSE